MSDKRSKNAAVSLESHEKRGYDYCRTPNGKETPRIFGEHRRQNRHLNSVLRRTRKHSIAVRHSHNERPVEIRRDC